MASQRIALAQIDTTVGDFAGNARKVREYTERARAQGASLVLFPELSLCGYPPRDFLDLPEFLARGQQTLRELAEPAEWSRGISVVVGFADYQPDAPPPSVYNASALIERGRVAAVGRKSLLPTYDVFDEARYFLPAPAVTSADAESVGLRLGLSICEDVWNDKRFWVRPRYARDPIGELHRAGASLVVNISASPYATGKPALRERMLAAAAKDHGAPIAYVNQVGGNDALLFDGGSMLVSAQGEVLARAPLFEEALLVCGLDGSGAPPLPEIAQSREEVAGEVRRALVMGLRDYARKCGFRRAVVGLSGGIDSALTCALAAEALGPRAVLGVAMPSRYSSEHSVTDARQLGENLGVDFRIVPIEAMHAAYVASLEKAMGEPLADLTEQNVQARIRGQILMAFSNELGGLVLSTGNKSELAVGYCTLYGDMAGGLAVIGDVPKTLVYDVSHAVNRAAGREVIPKSSLEKPPSAELKPGQLDTDSLPPYPVLDPILAAYIEERLPLDEIVRRGLGDAAAVRRVLQMVVHSEYKRRQAAPVLKISAKAFGEGRRYPIAHGYRY